MAELTELIKLVEMTKASIFYFLKLGDSELVGVLMRSLIPLLDLKTKRIEEYRKSGLNGVSGQTTGTNIL